MFAPGYGRPEHIWDFEKTRLNIQGEGSRKWQSRNTHVKEQINSIITYYHILCEFHID